LPSWADAKRVCVDVETKDPHLKQLGIGVRRGGFITGVSFTIEDGPSAYLPMRHEGGDNLDEAQVLAYLRAQAKVFKGDLVGANLQYDLDYLLEDEVDFKEVRYFRDIQIADPLIYELHHSFSLQNIAERNGLPGKDVSLLEEAARISGWTPRAACGGSRRATWAPMPRPTPSSRCSSCAARSAASTMKTCGACGTWRAGCSLA